MLENWPERYRDAISFPVKVQVGVGGSAREVSLANEAEFFDFYGSEESIFAYGDYLEISIVAMLNNLDIQIYNYKGDEGNWLYRRPDDVFTNKPLTKVSLRETVITSSWYLLQR